ncbi:ATP-binding protein [Streptomyces collinus]|uniref:ATP-binding protein n=1 Tax=Streptomyces collinus TaxID=42684 RepID=UPI0033C91D94
MSTPFGPRAGALEAGTRNEISGGLFLNAVIQGHHVTVQLPPTVTPALDGLPRPSSTFTGREDEVGELLAVLDPESSPAGRRVTTVTGLPGIGKTELVLQIARRALDTPGWFDGGVLFADLAGYDPDRRSTPDQILTNWLTALGIASEHLAGDREHRSHLLRSVLAAYADNGRRVLMMVDNAADKDQVEPLLPSDGRTAVLVTSRDVLHLRGGSPPCLLGTLDTYASVELLRQGIQRQDRAPDTRIEDDPEHAAEIATLCSGLPLALTICAALLADLPYKPAAAVAAALRDEHTRLDRLRFSGSDRPVRAAFDLSSRRLEHAWARMFRLLPLNPGPVISTESAAHLADLDQPGAEALLEDLSRAHLVEYVPGHWGRWRMHDLIRIYARELGDAHARDDNQSEALKRLLDHYTVKAQAAECHVAGIPDGMPEAWSHFDGLDQALKWLDLERASLVAAAVAAPGLRHPEVATELAEALGEYLRLRRCFRPWAQVARSALAVHQATDCPQGEASALLDLGSALNGLREFGEAAEALQRAADTFRDLGELHEEGIALEEISVAFRETGRLREAADACAAALERHEQLGDAARIGRGLTALGDVQQRLGEYDEAVATHELALIYCRKAGDRIGEVGALNGLGCALQEAGRADEAATVLADADRMQRKLEPGHGNARILTNLGVALTAIRHYEKGEAALLDAVGAGRAEGDPQGEGIALSTLGAVIGATGRIEQALEHLVKAEELCAEEGDPRRQGIAAGNLGVFLAEAGEQEAAIDTLNRAIALCREAGDVRAEAKLLTNLVFLLNGLGRTTEVVTWVLPRMQELSTQLGIDGLVGPDTTGAVRPEPKRQARREPKGRKGRKR